MAKTHRTITELTRLLNLLPYFQAHPDRSVMEAARDLGQSPQEIMEDLNRLWMCGLPGLLPGDLVDLESSYAQVKIINSQGLDKPLRLTPTEAGVLLLSLESLENLPGVTDQAAVKSAAAKLRSIMGDAAAAVYDSEAPEKDGDTLATIRAAMDGQIKVSFTYHSISSDTTSTRVVTPNLIFTNEGETYLSGWEERSAGHRTFRLDRIRDIVLVNEPGQAHPQPFTADDPFNAVGHSEVARVLIRSDATWLADYMNLELAEGAEPILDGQGREWFTVTAPLLSRDWFIRFAISYADVLHVQDPEDLRLALRQRADSGLAAYDLGVQ
ncbi:helix-turn-helix transcriptional regulator [Corynebacterium pacaense]|uniref:helix-turn-helix transcriptional regulator n=1 Tax=Corynebacterium pacaense TaxID=1816684 RepID=UPI0009BC5F45|nr:YafY family protein [Corynebacterium pacaense]